MKCHCFSPSPPHELPFSCLLPICLIGLTKPFLPQGLCIHSCYILSAPLPLIPSHISALQIPFPPPYHSLAHSVIFWFLESFVYLLFKDAARRDAI